jgi:hypothetical protein
MTSREDSGRQPTDRNTCCALPGGRKGRWSSCGCALDVDGDGWPDFVAGGAWYRNPRDPGRPFDRFAFDPELTAIHDVLAADLGGDGQHEIGAGADQNNLRW